MFSAGPNYNKLKTNLRLCINRLKLLEKKKTELALKQRKEIADYMANGKVERAKIRVEHIIREDYLVEAMEILEMYCDLLLARFGLIEQMKALDDGLSEAISSIIWATPRLQSDIQELKTVSDQLGFKYGKPYAMACRENGVGSVSEKLMHKLGVQAPPKLTVEKYLIEIAKYYNVEYEPDPQILKTDEAYAADNLIDVGPAPPPPDKNDLSLGDVGSGSGGGGAAAAMPPHNLPFVYPAMQPNPYGAAGLQQPFAYPSPQAPSDLYPGPLPDKEKDLLGFEEGPPPYFPPDVRSPPNATAGLQLPKGNQVQPAGTGSLPSNPAPKPGVPAGSASLPAADVPELPGVPVDFPIENGTPPDEEEEDKKEEEIDFDDLTRRFEALKKRK